MDAASGSCTRGEDSLLESFGARLKREREQRKITLDDISVATKIGTRFLAALEEERFDQLPGGIFNKGFVRAYARHLGIDENQAIADFVAASAPSLPEIPPDEEPPVLAAMAVRVPESKRKSRDGDGIPWGIVAVALLLLAFGFALWGFHSREKRAPSVPAPPPATNESSTAVPQKAAAEPVPAASQPAVARSPSVCSRALGKCPGGPAPSRHAGGKPRSLPGVGPGARGFLGQHQGGRQADLPGHADRFGGESLSKPGTRS